VIWNFVKLGLIYIALTTSAWAQDMNKTDNWADIITQIQVETELPGVGGLVLKDNEIIAQAFAGEKQKDTGLMVEADELWHIGSVTKSITATMIARLVEKNVLSWDDTIEDILGPKKVHKQWRGVTLRELLTHTSGAKANFPKLTYLFQPKTEAKTLSARKKHVRKVLKKKPDTEPGTAYQYSNVGFTIAAHLAEVKTGKSWEDLMREEVFKPLSLNSAGFGAPKPETNEDVAWGHRGDSPMEPSFLADNTPIMGPAGTVHMTLHDLAKFGQAHIDGLSGQSDYLSQDTFEVLHKARLEDYAMGWMEQKNSKLTGGQIFWHNGSNTMWYALLVAVPEENMVYALATNSGNVSAADKAFAEAMQTHFKSLKETE